jgi:hypothetical protein
MTQNPFAAALLVRWMENAFVSVFFTCFVLLAVVAVVYLLVGKHRPTTELTAEERRDAEPRGLRTYYTSE